MSLVIADRVKESSTTTGTGALTLAGAYTGFRAFSAVCTSPSDTCYYTIQAVDGAGVPTGDWEVGYGIYSAANTLTRTLVLASSNSGSLVSLSAGTKQVWIDLAAAQLAFRLPALPSTKWNEFDSNGCGFKVLSDGKTIVSSTSSGVNVSSRADTARSTGKYYFEFKHLRVDAFGTPSIGVGTASSSLTSYVGNDTNGAGQFSNGQTFRNGSATNNTSMSNNDIVGVAVDFTASTGSIKFYRNNVANGSYTSLTLSAMYPMASTAGNNNGFGMGRLCTRAEECTYSPPAGYSYWDA